MTEDAIVHRIRLMRAADELLMANEEYRVAAHLSLAIELLLERVGSDPYPVPNTRSNIVSIRAKW